MSWKVVLIGGVLLLFVLLYRSNFFGKMDNWNNSMRSGSEQRSGTQVETAPTPTPE